MRALKLLAAMAAISVAGLSGCSVPEAVQAGSSPDGVPPGHSSSRPNEDGRSCTEARSGEVYILVGYDATGMPVVHPERCHVDPGTRITWRGPDNDGRGFEIDFKAASASERGQDRVPSEEAGDRHKASIIARSGRGSFAYSVRANGKELDPQIIIDPR